LAGTNCTANWSASGGAQPFAERVTALTFVFYDGGGTPLATPLPASSLDTVRRIAVTVTTADTVTGSVPQPYTLRTEIRPRNLGLNP
jgi:hypothetical protein